MPLNFKLQFVVTGEKISLETRNNLLELLAYTGLGNNKIVDRRSKFVEHQALLCDPDTKPQFIPANVTRTKGWNM